MYSLLKCIRSFSKNSRPLTHLTHVLQSSPTQSHNQTQPKIPHWYKSKTSIVQDERNQDNLYELDTILTNISLFSFCDYYMQVPNRESSPKIIEVHIRKNMFEGHQKCDPYVHKRQISSGNTYHYNHMKVQKSWQMRMQISKISPVFTREKVIVNCLCQATREKRESKRSTTMIIEVKVLIVVIMFILLLITIFRRKVNTLAPQEFSFVFSFLILFSHHVNVSERVKERGVYAQHDKDGIWIEKKTI